MSISVRRQQSKKRVGASAENIWEKFLQKHRRNPVDETELIGYSKKLKGEVLPFGQAKALFTKKRNEGVIVDATKLPPARYHKDENVLLKGDRYGTIKFVGPVHSEQGLWYGIELHQGFAGDCDGSLSGYSYFSVDPGRGVFVREDDIRRRMTARDHKRSSSFQPHIDWKGDGDQPLEDVDNNAATEYDNKEFDETKLDDHQIVLDEEINVIGEDMEPPLRSNRLKEFKDAKQNPLYIKASTEETANLSYHDWPDRANQLAAQKNYKRIVDGSLKYRDKKIEGPLVGDGVNRLDPADYKELFGDDVSWPSHLFELSADLSDYSEVSQMDAICMQPSTAINTCLTPIVVMVNDHVHGWFYTSKMAGDIYGRSVQPSGTFKSIVRKRVVQMDRGPLYTARLSIGMTACYSINENLYLSFSCRDPKRTIAAGLLVAEERELESILIVPIKKSDFNEVDMKLFRKRGSDNMTGVRVDIYRWEPIRQESKQNKRTTHPVFKWEKELLLHWQSEGIESTRMLIRQILGRGVVNMQELEINEDIFQEASKDDVKGIIDSLGKRSWDPQIVQPLLEFLTKIWGNRAEYADILAYSVANGRFSNAAKYFLNKETKDPLPLFEQMAPFFGDNNNITCLAKNYQPDIYRALESIDVAKLGRWLLITDSDDLTPLHHAPTEESTNLILDTLRKNNASLLDMITMISTNISYEDVFGFGTIIHKYCSLGWINTLTRIMDWGIEAQSLLLDRNNNGDTPFELVKKNPILLKKFFVLFMKIQPSVRQKLEFYWSKKKAQIDQKEAAKNPLQVFTKSKT